MKIIKGLFRMLLVAAICFGAGYYVCDYYAETETEIVYVEQDPDIIYLPGEREVRIVTEEEIEVKLFEMSQLSTYLGTYDVEKTAEYTRHMLDDIEVLGTTNRIHVECSGIVKVGYEVEEIIPTVDNESMKIYIALPEPKVLDNYIKWDTVKVTEDNNILNPIDFAQYEVLFTEIQEEGLQQVLDNNIYQQAEEHLKVVVSNFLSGFIDYEIVFMGGI